MGPWLTSMTNLPSCQSEFLSAPIRSSRAKLFEDVIVGGMRLQPTSMTATLAGTSPTNLLSLDGRRIRREGRR